MEKKKAGRPKKDEGVDVEKTVYECNIAHELFAAWKMNLRQGDKKEIGKALKYSEPVIGRALNYGYCFGNDLVEGISSFFMDRIKRERSEAANLVCGYYVKEFYNLLIKTVGDSAEVHLNPEEFKEWGLKALNEIHLKILK